MLDDLVLWKFEAGVGVRAVACFVLSLILLSCANTTSAELQGFAESKLGKYNSDITPSEDLALVFDFIHKEHHALKL
jgi:hypothetical protein